jgi:hypothetical protein
MEKELKDDIARYFEWRATIELNELNFPQPKGTQVFFGKIRGNATLTLILTAS